MDKKLENEDIGFSRESTAVGNHLTLNKCKSKPISKVNISGNSKRTITIDGVEYIVPDGYILVDYIENNDSEGEAYIKIINRQLTPITKLETHIKTSLTSVTTNRQFIYGIGTAAVEHYIECNTIGNFSVAGGVDSGVAVVPNQVYELKHVINGSTNSQLYIDGVLKQTNTNYQSDTDISPITLCNWGGDDYSGRYVRIYYVTIYNNDELIYCLVPMMDYENELSGVYDFVSNKFYASENLDFIVGNELPTPDNELGVAGVGGNAGKYAVCMVLKHNATGEIIYVPVDDYDATTYADYILKPFVRYEASNGKNMLIYKDDITSLQMWADYNKYKLECDTTANGGFTWCVTINGTAKTGTVSWAAGDSLDSIVTQMNTGAVAKYLVFSHTSGEEFIRIRKGGYGYSIFTLSNITGTVTLTDLSKQMKISGVLQDTTIHRDWQTRDVHSWISDFLAASTTQYARNGYNKQYRCGINFAKFKAYFTISGSATYVTENSIGIMSSTGFAACGSSSVAAEKALYDKYSGDYDSYLKGQMIQIDDTHTDGMEYKNRSNGKEFTDLLASVTTLDFDGTWICPFPAAYQSTLITDTDFGSCCMMTNHDIAVVMEDTNFAKINRGIEIIGGGTKLSNTTNYWSVAQCSGYLAWFYYGDYGSLASSCEYYTYSVRPVLATSKSYGYAVPILKADNCGVVDLGSLNWHMTTQDGHENYQFLAHLNTITGLTENRLFVGSDKWTRPNRVGRYFLSNYTYCQNTTNNLSNSEIAFEVAGIYTVADFKKLVSGLSLYYQRSTDSTWNAPVIHNVYLDKPLLKIGNYADEVDVIKGKVIRRVGVKVLDGTESWAEYARISNCFYIGIEDSKASQGTNILSTHYQAKAQGTDKGVYCGATNIGSIQCGAFYFTNTDYSDVTSFQAGVAAQYATGTPVTVYYPLATPTEETITSLSLRTKLNDNYVDCQTIVPPSQLTSKYRSAIAPKSSNNE